MSAAMNLEAERAAEIAFPDHNSPHTSVNMRMQSDRAAFMDGYVAALRTAPAVGADGMTALERLEDIDLTWAIAGKLGEFYPQETPRDMEKNHRLARAIQRLPELALRFQAYAQKAQRAAIAADRQAQQYEKGQK